MMLIPPQYALATKAAIIAGALIAALVWHSSKVSSHDADIVADVAKKYNTIVMKQQADIIKQQLAQAEKEKKANETLSKNQEMVSVLSGNLRSVKLRKPASCNPVDMPAAGSSSSDTSGGSGLLQQAGDRDLDEAKQGLDALIERCDRLNIDAIKSNASRPN